MITFNYTNKHPITRHCILFFVYTACCIGSLYFSYYLRYDFIIPEHVQVERLKILFWQVPFKILLLYFFGQFDSLISYFRLPDLYRIFGAFTINAVVLIYLWFLFAGQHMPPRGVILSDYILSILLVASFRIFLRIVRERYVTDKSQSKHVVRVAIIGAGDVGASLVSELLTRKQLGMKPVVFLDDNKQKTGCHIHGVKVAGTPDLLESIIRKYMVQKVILALPSNSSRRIKELIEKATKLNIQAEVVPSMHDLASGQIKASRIRSVELEDVLGRDPVEIDSANIQQLMKGKIILVTGSGGSIGSELCRQIASSNPAKLILLEQSEAHLFLIEQELINEGLGGTISVIVGDILDEERMQYVFKQYSPNIVFHAAAHKHVPMMEKQPHEALRNNVIGTEIMCRLSISHGVSKFILISTDKAINPTNVMGASKRIAEIVLQCAQNNSKNKTAFMTVRFGNVLGSSGSVIPIFKKQIANGGPVTVTHPDVTRYFMTIPEAVGLVLQCAVQGKGGEIFILDMGSPMKIVDVAKQLIELSGFKPGIDIEIKYTGLRPGEKLFEELQHTLERLDSTEHSRIFRLQSSLPEETHMNAHVKWIKNDIYSHTLFEIKNRIKEIVPEYTPYVD